MSGDDKAVNYARHRATNRVEFFFDKQQIADEFFDIDWAWHAIPPGHPRSNQVLLIGETVFDRHQRLRRSC